jgi:hypothetical protein
MDPGSFGAGEAEQRQGGHLWITRRSVNKLLLSRPGSLGNDKSEKSIKSMIKEK